MAVDEALCSCYIFVCTETLIFEIGLNKKSLERAIFSFKQTDGGGLYFPNISGMFDSCRYRLVEGKVYGKFFEDGCYNDKFVEEL